jgi:Transposase
VVVGVRRIEVITGTGRRRRWSSDDKARILLESLKPGANVSEVARRHGLSPQQLFGWQREARGRPDWRECRQDGEHDAGRSGNPVDFRKQADSLAGLVQRRCLWCRLRVPQNDPTE